MFYCLLSALGDLVNYESAGERESGTNGVVGGKEMLGERMTVGEEEENIKE